MGPFFSTALVACCLSHSAPPDKNRPWQLFGDTQENFDKNIKPLVEGIGKAKQVALYEGLPHQGWERDLLAKELKDKKTVRLHDFPFYETAIRLTGDDAKKLTTLCSDAKSFGRYGGVKSCGGYHPDWCIEWKDAGNTYRVLICFGCHEARLYGPKRELWSDLDEATIKRLAQILRPYRKNRPEEAPQE